MPDKFAPHSYLSTLAETWVDWTRDYLTQQPNTEFRGSDGFQKLLPPGPNGRPSSDARSRALEMYNLGLLRGRLVPSQTNPSKGAIGWRLLANGEHIHTPLGYLEWLLASKNNLADTPAITSARLALDVLLVVQCYTEFTNGVRLSYVSLLEWLKGKFPHPPELSRVAWLRVLSAAMFSTTSQEEIGNRLLDDFLADAEQPRLLLLWRNQSHLILRHEALGELIAEGLSLFDVQPNKTFLYWIGKEPEARGIYSLAERGGAEFLADFAAEEARALRASAATSISVFNQFFHKNPTQHTPDILALLPELLKLPTLTQPTLHLMKTLREGAIEAVRQLYGAEAVSEIEPLSSGTPVPLPAEFPRQKILFGPPGTGKSYRIEHKYAAGHQLARTTFHPDTDYTGFVGAYKPVMNAKNEIEYQFRPQVFAQTYWEAWQHPEQAYFLVIEEINRGNCAQIFGDLFQLLDRDAAHYSAYAGRADADLAQWLSAQLAAADAATPDLRARYAAALHRTNPKIAPAEAGQWLLLPPNLCLYATMNTSDQSLFPMDSAFKRRWEWEYVPIDYADAFEVELDLGPMGRYNWGEFINAVNKRIYDLLKSEDKQLGNRFVNPVAGPGGRVITLATFKAKVLFYLWSDVYKLETENPDSIFYYQPAGTTDPLPFSYADLFVQEQDAAILPSFLELLAVPVWVEAAPMPPAANMPADAADATDPV